jgi:phage terminase small subunit
MATSNKSTQPADKRTRLDWTRKTAYDTPLSHLRPRQTPIAGVSQDALDRLTPKQQAFVREYLVDLNGAAAARRAGYSENSAKQIASENLTKPDVMMAIEEAFASLGGITRIRIVDELGSIAFADIGEFIDWSNETQEVSTDIKRRVDADIKDGSKPGEEVVVLTNRVVLKPSHKLTREQRRAIAKISQDRYGNVRLEMHDKLGALNSLARALGMFLDNAQVVQPSPLNLPATIIYEGRPGSTPGQLASPPLRRARDED